MNKRISVKSKLLSVENLLVKNGIELSRALIITSNKCNLNCNYCFVPKNKPAALTYEQIETFIKWYVKQPGKDKKLNFLGGEPFLDFDLIRKTVRLFKKHSGKNSVISIPINGTILDKEILDFIVKEGPEVGLSLDGDRIGNMERHFKNKKESFSLVWGNLNKFKEAVGYPPVINMTFFPGNLKNLYSNIKFLIDNGFYKINPQPAIFTIKWSKKDLEILACQFKKVIYSYLKLRLFNKPVQIYPIDEILSGLKYGKLREEDFSCELGNKVILSYDGNIYACDSGILENKRLKKRLKIGFVTKDNINVDLEKLAFFRKYSVLDKATMDNKDLAYLFKRRICFSLDGRGNRLKREYLNNTLNIYLTMFEMTIGHIFPYLNSFTESIANNVWRPRYRSSLCYKP